MRKRYAEAAKAASAGTAGCCGPGESSCGCGADALAERDGTYRRRATPARSAIRSRGGKAGLAGLRKPTAVAELHDGETVLDLGSGGGIDVLLSAGRVGPTGKAYGLDMTDEMLELARHNHLAAGVENVEFIKGTIERIPLPDESVDVVISNCVLNLSADKPQVFREAARVLRPGGRFAVTDVVADAELDQATRHDLRQWTGCIAGALTVEEFVASSQAPDWSGSRSGKPIASTRTQGRPSSEPASRSRRASTRS